MTEASRLKSLLGLLAGVVLVVSFVGAAQMMRSLSFEQTPDPQTAIVTLHDGTALRVQKREVTIAQWQECHLAGHCKLAMSPRSGTEDYPATGLSYPDAMEYLRWLNTQSARVWRLPTAAEWAELAQDVMPQAADPIFTDPSLTWASTYLTEANKTGRALRPSGAFSVTSAGIEDLDGNVWEWTMDCYAGASGQGDRNPDRCPAYVMGGEHEAVMSYLVRDPARGGCAVGAPPAHLGVRFVSAEN